MPMHANQLPGHTPHSNKQTPALRGQPATRHHRNIQISLKPSNNNNNNKLKAMPVASTMDNNNNNNHSHHRRRLVTIELESKHTPSLVPRLPGNVSPARAITRACPTLASNNRNNIPATPVVAEPKANGASAVPTIRPPLVNGKNVNNNNPRSGVSLPAANNLLNNIRAK